MNTIYKTGDRIELTQRMEGEIFNGKYNGIEVGEKGTIEKVQDFLNKEIHLSVKWDNGRTLNIILPIDKIKKCK